MYSSSFGRAVLQLLGIERSSGLRHVDDRLFDMFPELVISTARLLLSHLTAWYGVQGFGEGAGVNNQRVKLLHG